MRYHEALRESTNYLNQNYRGRAAREAGRNVGKVGKKEILADAAKSIEMAMRAGESLTEADVHAIVDSLAESYLEDLNDDE